MQELPLGHTPLLSARQLAAPTRSLARPRSHSMWCTRTVLRENYSGAPLVAGRLFFRSDLARQTRVQRNCSGCHRTRRNGLPESRWSCPGHLAEDAGEMALVGEAALRSNTGERPLPVAHQFARGPHLQSLLIFARSASFHLAEHSCQMHRMNSGL